jgi:hypothetical protein
VAVSPNLDPSAASSSGSSLPFDVAGWIDDTGVDDFFT